MRNPSLPHRRFRPLALEPIEPRRLLAFDVAELVADVDDRPRWFATNPQEITPFAGGVVYVASTHAVGTELFISDGTKAGTHLLRDLRPGPLSFEPEDLTVVNGTLFFSAKTATNGRELWRSDGTAAGTHFFKDIRPGKGGSDPQGLVNVDGTLYFTANDGVHGHELWKSDGTWGGTKLVKDLVPGGASADVRDIVAANGLAFFTTLDSENGSVLWSSDGTAAGTQPLTSGGVTSPNLFRAAEVDDELFFTADSAATGWELWKTDGTAAGTQLVLDVRPGIYDSYPRDLINLNGTLVFHANDGIHGRELWRSDGTGEGTTLVADLHEGPGGINPKALIHAGDVVYFTDDLGRFLWKSNGTSAGTALVYDFFADDANAELRQATASADGHVYFSADAGDGFELWRTDGTAGGTVQVKDIWPGKHFDDYGSEDPNSSSPHDFQAFGNGVVFSATDENGRHLWFSDGAEAGTQRLDDIAPTTPSSEVQGFYNFNGKLLFSAKDAEGHGLWINDASGTRLLARNGPHNLGLASEFVTIGNTVYFGASPATPIGTSAGRELWKTDGTAAGTILVADINTDTVFSRYFPRYHQYGSEPSDFTEINGKVVFAAAGKDDNNAKQLWITDGTGEGTSLLKDIVVGSRRVDRTFIKLGAHVYFAAFVPDGDYQLWRTDGTEAGTIVVEEIVSADNQPYPGVRDLTLIDGTIFFSATDAAHGRELWKSDGTAAGTVLVRDIRAGAAGSSVDNLVDVDGTLFFTTSSSSSSFSLWKSDGTSGGTKFVASIGAARYLTNAGGTLYFSSNLGGSGHELWKSDGTAAGTQMVKDLAPGARSSNPRRLQEINDILFFEAELPGGGRGFWRSDGTEGDTQPIAPIIPPSPGLIGYQSLTNVSSELYFAGADFEHGQELWKLKTAHPVVQLSGTINYQEGDPPKLIAPWARVSDKDQGSFDGLLSVVIQANADSGDRLEIRHQGDGPGQIGFDEGGSTVRYQGFVIGTIRDALPGSRLIIKLNHAAQWDATSALLRNITYRNVSDNPSTAPRTLVVTLSDGNGGMSQPVSKTINVEAVNDPPRLVLGGQVAYANNSPAILLAPAAVVSDPDSANFFGGVLTVDITSGGGPSNRLWVSGAYTLSGDRLLRNGVLVGTVLDSGVGWNPLRLQFNAQMTAARVQELVRSLRFRTFDNENLDPRIISFSLTDGDGGVSATQTKTVNITA